MPEQTEKFDYYEASIMPDLSEKSREQLETLVNDLQKEKEILNRELKSKQIMHDIKTKELRAHRETLKAIESILTVFRVENEGK